MPTAEYLRRQAENCLRIARTCFDLGSAERMRLLARDLKAKAAELEDDEQGSISPATLWRNPSEKPNRG
jgi:hypothetical protein